jgi:hypothetical protein
VRRRRRTCCAQQGALQRRRRACERIAYRRHLVRGVTIGRVARPSALSRGAAHSFCRAADWQRPTREACCCRCLHRAPPCAWNVRSR